MCHNGAKRTERGARGSESGIGAAAQALVQGSAWGFVRGSARGCAGVCRGMRRRRVRWNRAGCGTTAGESVAGGVLRREGYRDGKQTGHSGGKGGRNEGAREWTWRLSGADSGDSSVDGLRSVPGQGDSGVVRPFAARYDRFFLLGGRPFAAVCPFIGSGPLQRCWQAFLGLNNPLPRCGAGFSRTGGDVLWRGPRYRSAAVSCAQR